MNPHIRAVVLAQMFSVNKNERIPVVGFNLYLSVLPIKIQLSIEPDNYCNQSVRTLCFHLNAE